nr:phosphodiester glycosidase family protein [Peteryoungia desertarenae]
MSCAHPAVAAKCGPIAEQGARYVACEVDPAKSAVRVHHSDPNGRPFGGFDSLARQLWAERRVLTLAMNGGMYHRDLSPVGLLIENGEERSKLIIRGGWGNFHLLPNGVFLVKDGRPQVMETRAFQRSGLQPDFATQSGPMLVIDGKIHPRFLPDSDSFKIRNGVGVDADGHLHLVISRVPVRFYDFALLFRDRLKTKNALYLDGTISSLYSPELDRRDRLFPIGPIISVSEIVPFR